MKRILCRADGRINPAYLYVQVRSMMVLAVALFTLMGCNGLIPSQQQNHVGLRVVRPEELTSSILPAATVEIAYKTYISVRGGTPPYSWSVASGKLPPGLQLNASTGSITGTPSLAGSYSFTVQVNDTHASAVSGNVSLNILSPVAPVVTQVYPNSGSSTGGTVVNILGQNFRSGAVVYFGGISATLVQVVNSMNMKVTAPPESIGTVDVTIEDSDSQTATAAKAYSFVAPTLPVSAQPSGQVTSPIVWTESSLVRIPVDSPAGTSKQIEIYAARNETYSFQIGVQAPAGGLTNVDVVATGLVGPGGGAIQGRDISLFREHYIYVPVTPPYYWTNSSDGTNPPEPPGWYPDGLLPFVDPETGQSPAGGVLKAAPFSVASKLNQPVWVDIHIPASATAGLYAGEFSVTSDQGRKSVQVSVHVWDFTLPDVPSFKTSYQASSPHQDIYMAHELLRNRVSPDWDTGAEEQSLIKAWGLTSTNLWFSSGLGVQNCATAPILPAPSSNEFATAAAHHQANLLIYNFSADEIGRCSRVFPMLKVWAANMHAAGVKNLVTVEPTPDLLDDGTGTGRSAVDIWTVLPQQYDDAQKHGNLISLVLSKGDAVWTYNVLVQDGYSPKLEINFAPLNYRLTMGFISQSLGITGFQQWSVDQWTSDPWNSMTVSPGGVPSDGLLVFPGGTAGLVGYASSMRLKWTRDGIDDFEYIQILKKLGQGAWALQQAAKVGPNWRDWTHDYKQVEALHVTLGNRIELLSSSAH
jgi:Domain of unknown function (DUF4091)/Putative Ig domain/IPT/TIG domain